MRGLENFSVEVYRSLSAPSLRDGQEHDDMPPYPVGEMAAMGVWSVDYIF